MIMSKTMFGVCTLCGEEIYEDKFHRCKFKNVKDNLIHYMKMEEKNFETIWKAQNFIRDNIWNVEDKEQIKELLLIIWNSNSNQEFEIKCGDDNE